MVALTSDILQTIIILWIFTWAAMIIMILRLVMRKSRKQRFEASDYVTMACMFCLLVRNGMNHVVLIWGTNDVTEAFRASYVFTADDIYQREVGSKLVVINRLFYNTYIWLQKVVVMCLYQRFLFSVHWANVAMKFNWAILAVTYVAIQISTVAECRPFYLYWQVVPDPGSCVQALLELFVLGALNIFTDIILIVLPMPTLIKLKLSFFRRCQLVLLFSVGILLVVVTIVRLPQNYANIMAHVNRITWGSVEALAAAFVANMPTLYSLRRRAATPGNLGKVQEVVVANRIEMHDQKLATCVNEDEHFEV